MEKTAVEFLALSVFLLFLRGTFAANHERTCRNHIIDCGEQVISFKETPIARTLPDECQNEAGCRNEVGCQPTQNCTSLRPVEIFMEDCSCKSSCRVKKLQGHENCYYFDVIYECVDACNTWLLPVIIASSVAAVILLVIIIICIIRRRQKQRRKSTLIGPEYLQRAHEMHQLRNEKPSNPNSNQKTNVSEMNAGDVDAADPSNAQDGQNTCHLRQGSARSSGKPCSLTDCCSVNEALTSSGQRASLDSRNSSNLNTSGEYVMVENNSLKIYVTNDDGKLTIPRTKLNKNPGTVLEGVDIPALYHHNTTPTEADCGDYDNMMFGNCGDQESNQSEAPTSWQTHLNKSEPEVLCDDVYDNVQYEENHGHLVTGLGREELMSQFPVEPDDGMANRQPQCHNLTNADFGLLYDNVEFSEGCGNIVDNGSEASNQGECNLDYDNVDFNEGHGEVVEVVEKGIVRLQSRSLPVIYEYDEGISMENDEYDYVDEGQGQDEAMTLREADAVNNGANQVVNNENNHGIPLPQGQRKVLQGHEESSVQSPAQGLSNLGQGHSDFENMVNKLILDQEADASRENNKQDLYESLQHSSFQKPVDYGMKLNMLHHQADGRPRVRGQGHISPPVSQQTPLSGVIDKDVYPSSCDYSQSSIHDEGDYLEPIPYRRPTDNDLSQGQGAQGYFPSGNSNDKDIFQSDEYY